MRVLIHNSDSPANRGDRAILVGVIELVRRTWPDAEIWSLSQYPERDAEWFGIKFLPQSPYSTNPAQWVALFRLARSSDIVLWGGGEILKDYTNKLGLFYWLLKMTLLSIANPNLVGVFQGIGPTTARISKYVIRLTVNRTRVFLVRDDESLRKLKRWHVRTPIVASFDPAVLGIPVPINESVEARLVASGVDPAILPGAIGFGLRPWFHYRQSGWLPHRFRRAGKGGAELDDTDVVLYRERAAQLADELIERYDAPVVFFPMHLDETEGDASFAESVVRLMRNSERTAIVAQDVFSPTEYAGLLAELRVFVAARLHSAIVATTAAVPSFVLYYVDKGRLYFEQIGMQRYSAPIAMILEDGAVERLVASVDDLVSNSDEVRAQLKTKLDDMSQSLEKNFAEALAILGRQ